MKKEDEDFNIKCAEYLKWDFLKGYWIRPGVTDVTQMRRTENLGFHSDWNWLMLVLHGIQEECSEKDEYGPYGNILDNIPDLKHTKQAILDYFNIKTE